MTHLPKVSQTFRTQTSAPTLFASTLLIASTIVFSSLSTAANPVKTYRAIVNSNADEIKLDNGLTLREAIALINGELNLTDLSATEQAQVKPGDTASTIAFNLPTGQTKIQLRSELLAIAQPGTLIDGTTQPGYDASKSAIREAMIPVPVVELTVAADAEVARGLTIVSDRVTVRGLSLYGFTTRHRSTQLTPPSDIFITHRTPPPNTQKQNPPANFAPYYPDDVPPKNVVIEANWLGIMPNARPGPVGSAFGVSVFNGVGTQIRNNRIESHEGSGVITSVAATDTDIDRNVIVGNGLAGMPDAIRLEGDIDRSKVHGNVMCGNDGSGIYLFKPTGSVKIYDNDLRYNGRRLRRAAVYLTGSGHQVENNKISHQAGSGVVVGAYPKSVGNTIVGNRFDALEGMSIDLNTQENTNVQAWQTGDGPNPKRKGGFRHLETGNAAMNAPEFSQDEFENAGTIAGIAEPNSQVAIYKVNPKSDSNYGPLSLPIAQTTADAQGKFSANLSSMLNLGDRISATATDARGTSEPSINAAIGPWSAIEKAQIQRENTAESIPPCTTPPDAPKPPDVPPLPAKLQLPTRVHFALDQDLISPESAKILTRIATVMQQYPGIVLDLEGHTDPRATNDYNQALGMRRAVSTRNYLLKQGISANRMTVRSQGETKRITTSDSPLDTARDRRVELIYRNSDGFELTVEESDLQPER